MVSLAALIFRQNPLAPRDDIVVALEPGAVPFDWLAAHYPNGCGHKVWHYHNKELIDADSPDYLERPVAAGDVVHLVTFPGEPISLTTILVTALVTAAVSAAVSIGLSLLFPKPTAPTAATPGAHNAASPAYDVRSRQNIARLGEPVPAVYGRVIMTPDLCASPYAMYQAGTRGMWVDLLMCLGHGEFDIHQIFVGESEADRIEGGAARYIVVPPNVHGGQFGNLNGLALAAGWEGGFVENAYVSQEVGEQRFTYQQDQSGWFRVGRAGIVRGSVLYLLMEWPRGLYQMPDWGDPTGTIVNFNVYVDEADADGAPVPGTRQFFHYPVNGGSMDPRRDMFAINLGRDAAWLVKVERVTPQYPNGDEMNEFYWRALFLSCNAPGPAYGNVTLLMVRLFAEQVASSADRLVRVELTRKLPVQGAGAPLATTDPADAFIDVLTNPTYGGRRPLSEVDTDRLATLRNYWGGYQFNAVYAQKTTVWEALTQTVQGVAAAPLPVGGLMSIAQDGIRPVRSMMFTEQNIVKGSFQLAYHFEPTGAPDGVEVEYVDAATWSPAYVRFPASSLAPDRINLFGCSDPVQAAQIARLQWQRRQKLRRLVTFETELEGLIPNPGERIAVAHTLPRWGVSGLVADVAFDGVNITLDRALPWGEVAAPFYMMFRDEWSGASAIVQAFPGSAANQATLASSPWGPGQDWRLSNTQERTHFAWGDGARVVKDFTLTSLAPKGGKTVAVEGVVYDPAVYDQTLYFLANAVP
jgi:Putative phage tail protein